MIKLIIKLIVDFLFFNFVFLMAYTFTDDLLIAFVSMWVAVFWGLYKYFIGFCAADDL